MGVTPQEYAPPQGAFYMYVDLTAHGVTDSLGMCGALLEEVSYLPTDLLTVNLVSLYWIRVLATSPSRVYLLSTDSTYVTYSTHPTYY